VGVGQGILTIRGDELGILGTYNVKDVSRVGFLEYGEEGKDFRGIWFKSLSLVKVVYD
jgi:hypothetical protein